MKNVYEYMTYYKIDKVCDVCNNKLYFTTLGERIWCKTCREYKDLVEKDKVKFQ